MWVLAVTAGPALAAEVMAEPPASLAVTLYRAPFRTAGSIALEELNGFALVTETRTVHLPAGESRLRFEGVADGIDATTAIVTGLPGGVIEKNRDALLLSPATLVAANVGKSVQLFRTNRKTGKTQSLLGTLISDADGGVVFKTAEGIEALRCSGMPETFSFTPTSGLSARPTLSVQVRTPRAVTSVITLSYLSSGFDWAANYSATLSADGKSMDLGAWVTLANSNGVGFPGAHIQVVAGKLNREDGEVEAIDAGGPILATCWPRGSTSDVSPGLLRTASVMHFQVAAPMARAAALEEIVVTGAQKVQQEQLGDLKLYRVPERTTLASRQSKQVRLLDRFNIPISSAYVAEISQHDQGAGPDVYRMLRTKNSTLSHLGLPLPSGAIDVFSTVDAQRLLEHEALMRDLAVDEEVEINMGPSTDVQVAVTKESSAIDSLHAQLLPLVPGVTALRSVKVEDINRVEISNARATDIQFELRLLLHEGERVIRADRPVGAKNGRPLFKLSIAANASVAVRYQTQRTATDAVRVR
jgi:hypothetical protein